MTTEVNNLFIFCNTEWMTVSIICMFMIALTKSQSNVDHLAQIWHEQQGELN